MNKVKTFFKGKQRIENQVILFFLLFGQILKNIFAIVFRKNRRKSKKKIVKGKKSKTKFKKSTNILKKGKKNKKCKKKIKKI